MGIKKFKAMTAGTRFRSILENDVITRKGPEKALTESLNEKAGRNHHGHITTRRRGGGHKRRYRVVDFKRDKFGVPAVVSEIEYDPNRSANIALITYEDGEKRYILHPEGLKVGDRIMSGPQADVRIGCALPLELVPLGTSVHNVELKPRKGGQMARSAGSSVQVMAKEGDYVTLRLPSTEMRRVRKDCLATIGEVGNGDHELLSGLDLNARLGVTLTTAVSGTGDLTYNGPGRLTLAAENTYTGATIVSGGTLLVNGSLAAASAVTVDGGTLGGDGTIGGAVTVVDGGLLAPGVSSGTLTLGGLTLEDGADVDIAQAGTSLVQINGDYTDNGLSGSHLLRAVGATGGTPYPFLQWTGTSNVSAGPQSNWFVGEGADPTKNWIGDSLSDVWTNPAAWDGISGSVSAAIDAEGGTLSFVVQYGGAPQSSSDVIIDPGTSDIEITSSAPVDINSLQLGGSNNSSPTLTLDGDAAFNVAGELRVTGNGTLNAVAGPLTATTLTIDSADAVATLGHASGNVAAANVSAGTLTVNGGTVGEANLSGTGMLVYGTDDAIGSGAVTINGSGAALDLGGYSDTVGAVTLTDGSITGTGTLTSTGGFTMNNTNATAVSASLGGSVGLTKSEAGTLTLSGTNSYTGATDIQAGVLELTGTLGSGGGTAITSAATFTEDGTGVIAGTSSLTVTAGTTTLAGTNTYTGATTITGGMLVLRKQTVLNDDIDNISPTNITVEAGAVLGLAVGDSGGLFDSTAIDTVLNATHMGASTTESGMKSGAILGLDTTDATAGTFTHSHTIGDMAGGPNSIGLAKFGEGTLILEGDNDYTGMTTVYAGTLQAGWPPRSARFSGLVFGADSTGKMQLNGNSMTVGGLTTNAAPARRPWKTAASTRTLS